jgi:hypothetical protein
MSHDYIEFQDSLEDDDYGIIIGKDGMIKGIWIPRHLEYEDEIPAAIANMCEDTFGINPNDEALYHTIQ